MGGERHHTATGGGADPAGGGNVEGSLGRFENHLRRGPRQPGRGLGIILRDTMRPGQSVLGPSAITEDETTIVLPSSRRAVSQPDGCIDIVRQA